MTTNNQSTSSNATGKRSRTDSWDQKTAEAVMGLSMSTILASHQKAYDDWQIEKSGLLKRIEELQAQVIAARRNSNTSFSQTRPGTPEYIAEWKKLQSSMVDHIKNNSIAIPSVSFSPEDSPPTREILQQRIHELDLDPGHHEFVLGTTYPLRAALTPYSEKPTWSTDIFQAVLAKLSFDIQIQDQDVTICPEMLFNGDLSTHNQGHRLLARELLEQSRGKSKAQVQVVGGWMLLGGRACAWLAYPQEKKVLVQGPWISRDQRRTWLASILIDFVTEEGDGWTFVTSDILASPQDTFCVALLTLYAATKNPQSVLDIHSPQVLGLPYNQAEMAVEPEAGDKVLRSVVNMLLAEIDTVNTVAKELRGGSKD